MIIEFGNHSIQSPIWIIVVICFILAFVVTYYAIPSIVSVSREKKLFDKPNQRKSHTSEIPTLGGAAIFLGMLLPAILISGAYFEHELKYAFISLLILFYIGIKDDILEISAKKKLIAELFAIAIVVILGDIRISSFHGLLGINELPYLVSVLFTFFVYIVIINGFNLIDGIDGLAAGIGMLSVTSLGIWFLVIGASSYGVFCFSVVGALLAFFRFNVFGKRNKIFLGDTGSLILGMVISIFTIRFLESTLPGTVVSSEFPAPAIAIAILIVPLIDTLRVFTLRILVGKSPFKPDRFHIHHKLLLLGYSHLKSTLIIMAYNLIVILFSFSLHLQHLGNIKMLMILIPVSILATSIPGLIFRYKVREVINQLDILGNKSWILPITFTNLIIYYVRKINPKKYLTLESNNKLRGDDNVDLDMIINNAYLKFKDRKKNGETFNLKTTIEELKEAGS